MTLQEEISPFVYALVRAKETFEESLKEHDILKKQEYLKSSNSSPNLLSGIVNGSGLLENIPEPYRTGAKLFLSMPTSKSADLLSLYMKMHGKNSDGSEKTISDLLANFASYAVKFVFENKILGEK